MRYILLIFSLLSLCTSFAAEQAEPIDSLKTSEIVETTAPQATSPESLWDGANTAYVNGSYQSAIELYTEILNSGLSSDKLLFNLGNAYYKLDDMAHAILYYQKALLLSHNDVDIRHNLGVAQSQIKDQIEVMPELFMRRWGRSVGRALSCTGWSILSLIMLIVLLGSILLFALSSSIRLRKSGFGVGLFSAIIFCVATLYALDERRELLEHNNAVVMSQSISIKSSPDRSATDLFMLHSGTTVKILREMDEWYEISIADGKKGWIESRRIEKI